MQMFNRTTIADMTRIRRTNSNQRIVFGQVEFNILERVQLFGPQFAKEGYHGNRDVFFGFGCELKDELVPYTTRLHIES